MQPDTAAVVQPDHGCSGALTPDEGWASTSEALIRPRDHGLIPLLTHTPGSFRTPISLLPSPAPFPAPQDTISPSLRLVFKAEALHPGTQANTGENHHWAPFRGISKWSPQFKGPRRSPALLDCRLDRLLQGARLQRLEAESGGGLDPRSINSALMGVCALCSDCTHTAWPKIHSFLSGLMIQGNGGASSFLKITALTITL